MSKPTDDPVLRSGKREAIVVFCMAGGDDSAYGDVLLPARLQPSDRKSDVRVRFPRLGVLGDCCPLVGVHRLLVLFRPPTYMRDEDLGEELPEQEDDLGLGERLMELVSPTLLFAATEADKPSVGYGTPLALAIFILASVWIGMLANKAMASGSFMKGFFLGNRGLGAWALAARRPRCRAAERLWGFPRWCIRTAGPSPCGFAGTWSCRSPVSVRWANGWRSSLAKRGRSRFPICSGRGSTVLGWG